MSTTTQVELLSVANASVAACCGTGEPGRLDEGAAAELAVRLKALADPTRLRLLSIIAAHADGEACVCDLTVPVGLSQPTVSHHLKILVDAGMLTRDKRGVWAYYRLVPAALPRTAADVVAITTGGDAPHPAG